MFHKLRLLNSHYKIYRRHIFYYMYRFYLTMSIARMKIARGSLRSKSSGSFMLESITGVLGRRMEALDARSATKSFITRSKVFWRMQEEEMLAPSRRSILAGWRTPCTLSTWRSFTFMQDSRPVELWLSSEVP